MATEHTGTRTVLRRRQAARLAILLLLAVALSSCAIVRPFTTALFGEARVRAKHLPAGDLAVPDQSRPPGPDLLPPADLTGVAGERIDALLEEWASREIPDWREEGKVTAPRVLLAKLAVAERDPGASEAAIEELNAYLLAAEPWAGIGSTWVLRPRGDYDFSLPPLTAILYRYGDRPELLYPQTREHLLAVLLNQEGDRFRTTVPRGLWLVAETENHILMTEGSRYLKNQWLAANGSTDPAHDNAGNGLEDELVSFIREIDEAGAFEFNSTPYIGYTLMALLTLEAYAADPVADAARATIDRINYEYALGSIGLRRWAPYRRQRSRADRTDLSDHPHTAMMRTWVALAGHAVPPVESNTHQAIYAALMPYRLPESVADLAVSTSTERYVQIGRGPRASPEIYSAGDGWLLSAGGTGRPTRSQIVARPITLMLADGADDLSQLFWLGGEGAHERWNNTGVVYGAAVGEAPLHVPAGRVAVDQAGPWHLFVDDATGVSIAAAETDLVAALVILDAAGGEGSTSSAFSQLSADNPAQSLDEGRLLLADSVVVHFDIGAPHNRWVITAVDGEPTESDLTEWPRLSGWIGADVE